MGKWPLIFESVDAFTLDLRKAYEMDGVFLPTREMLKEVGKYRNVTSAYFKVMISERCASEFCGSKYHRLSSEDSCSETLPHLSR